MHQASEYVRHVGQGPWMKHAAALANVVENVIRGVTPEKQTVLWVTPFGTARIVVERVELPSNGERHNNDHEDDGA